MKNIALLCLLMACSFIGKGQAYDSATRYRMPLIPFYDAADTLIARAMAEDPDDTTEAGEVAELTRWKEFMGKRICNDVSPGADIMSPYAIALSAYASSAGAYCTAGSPAAWTCLGPNINYFAAGNETQGRVNAIWVNPGNHNTILLGSDGGGLWKSNDGGQHWRNITDNAIGSSGGIAAMTGVYQIAVNPLDTNNIYIALGISSQYGKSGGYNLGLAYTTDGGSTWTQDALFTTRVPDNFKNPVKIAFMPGTSDLYAICAYKVLFSDLSSWNDITPDSTRWYWDFQFSKQSPGKFIVTESAYSGTSDLWITDNQGLTWTSQSMNLTGLSSSYNQYDYHDGAIHFCITSQDTAYMEFVTHHCPGDACISVILIKTPISAFSPMLLNASFPTGFSQFDVSPANSNVIYAANYDAHDDSSQYRSIDQGRIFHNYSGDGHADGRCLYIFSGNSDPVYDEVYLGNDGGIRKKAPGNDYFRSITGEGLVINEFYGLGNTEADEKYIVAGAQDNGSFSYIQSRSTPWVRDFGGDCATPKMMHDDIQNAVGQRNTTHSEPVPRMLYRWTFTGTTSIVHTYSYGFVPPENGPLNRALQFDHSENALIGYRHVWKEVPGSFSWAPALLGGLGVEPLGFLGADIADFYIDEQNNNNAYIAYNGPGSNQLFYSKNAQNILPVPSWINMTSSLCSTNGINTIAVDPQNHGRLWVGLANVNAADLTTAPTSMVDRVLYSSDSGATWTDSSIGLPPLPINKLLYRRGTNDELYAATDVGVFRWNRSAGSWECYNTGLPPCVVTDMEINYCANKLRISTYGRGIWETALPVMTPGPDANTTTITGGTPVIWSTNKFLENSISVQPGATLIIQNATIHMPKNAVIAVEPGGHLLVENATITNSCEQCMWRGIEARGQVHLAQTPANQGWVQLLNATIEHAQKGVLNTDLSVGYGANGGIIQCANSTFLNNTTSAEFQGYDNFHGSVLFPNVSYFNNCTFLLDNNFKGNIIPGATMQNMVRLESVEGIRFSGCRFLNRDMGSMQKGIGEGIHSSNSAFNVVAACPAGPLCFTPTIRSRFCGFNHGIYVGGLFQIGLGANIDNADFDTCTVGVDVLKFDNVSTTRSNFIVGHGNGEIDVHAEDFLGCAQNIGILLQNSKQFRVEGNSFHGKDNSGIAFWTNFGTVVAESGKTGTAVYRNSFDSLTQGVCAIGVNFDLSIYGGLQIGCNTFSHNTNDILVVNDGTTVRDQGIARTQGSPLPVLPFISSTGNTFVSSSSNIISSNCWSIIYDYDGIYSSTQRPNIVTPVADVLLNPITWLTGTNTCPSGFDPVVLTTAGTAIGTAELGELKSDFMVNKTTLQAATAVYDSRIDFGNTDSLLHVIDTIHAGLYSILTSGAPYISKKSIVRIADSLALSHLNAKNVLIQNPDNLRDPVFIAYVDSAYHFSSNEMIGIEAVAQDTTSRTALENTINIAQGKLSSDATLIMMALKSPIDTTIGISDTTGICLDTTSVYYLVDSNSFYAGLDSIDTWLQKIEGTWTLYERAGYYNFRGQNTTADSLMSVADGIITDTTERATYDSYALLWNAIKNAESDGRSVYSLDSSEIATFDTSSAPIFSSNDGMAMLLAMRMIIVPYAHYFPCIDADMSYSRSSTHKKIHPAARGEDGDAEFSVYPNPTNGIVTFTYNVPEGSNMTITVTNLLGEKVMEQRTSNSNGNLKWDSHNVVPGVYIYQAGCIKGMVSKGKLVVIR